MHLRWCVLFVSGMKKTLFQNQFFLVSGLIFVSALTGCGTSGEKLSAPVVEKNIATSPVPEKNDDAKPVAPAEKPLDTTVFYVVKRGDTLIRIALDHGKSYSDLVTWNSLTNPNDIKVDQVLRIAPPDASAGSAEVEVKPLPSLPNPAINKTGPRGDKRPFSEAALTELQKPDAGLVPSALAITPKATVPVAGASSTAIPVKVQEQIAANVNESEAVDWIWPTAGKVIASFDDTKNKGIDIAGQAGQDVLAAGAGKVMYEGSAIRGWGNLVIIRHNDNLVSAYAHNRVNLVKEGQLIKKGQKIAEMGNTDADTVKLHFEIRQNGKPVDPSKFLPAR
jgi:lipoprotein NlpD